MGEEQRRELSDENGEIGSDAVVASERWKINCSTLWEFFPFGSAWELLDDLSNAQLSRVYY